MMTHEEMMNLPIPEEYKDTPNFYRLAKFIQSTGNARQIMAALEVALPMAMKKEDAA